MTPYPIRILLVDDDEVDREAVERGFAAGGIALDLVVAGSGEEALRLLRGSPDAQPLARPFIILLDLNMPLMDGPAFLDALRADAGLRDSIVFVLTTSTREIDRGAAYRRNVAGYIAKAAVGEDCALLVGLIDAYWRLVELP